MIIVYTFGSPLDYPSFVMAIDYSGEVRRLTQANSLQQIINGECPLSEIERINPHNKLLHGSHEDIIVGGFQELLRVKTLDEIPKKYPELLI